MSKFVTFQVFDAYLSADIGISTPFMNTASKTKVDFQDVTTGTHLTFIGENFKVSHGLLDSGTIDDIAIRSHSGKLLAMISDVNIDAATVSGTTALEILTDAVQRVTTHNIKYIGSNLDDSVSTSFGNDLLLGGKGDDTLNGGTGKDTMTGGPGSDTFQFTAGNGKDTVTDFDADGGAGNQDFIGANFADMTSIEQVGANTVIHFGVGDSLTLLHVDKTHITADDFAV